MEFDFGTLATVLGPSGVDDAIEDEFLVAGFGGKLLAEGGIGVLEGFFLAWPAFAKAMADSEG